MERGRANTLILTIAALALGFLVGYLVFGTGDNSNASSVTTVTSTLTTTANSPATSTLATTTATPTTTTSTTSTTATPTTPAATIGACISLWNQANNRANQTFLVNIASQQPIRVHVGRTTDVPPKCSVTVTTNSGGAYVFPEAGGTTYPYAQAPALTQAASLPASQKISNALEQSDGTLRVG